MSAKHIRINARLVKNGVRRTACLDGYAYLQSGFLTGLIVTNDLSNSDQALLTAFTFTGCPVAANVRTEAMTRGQQVLLTAFTLTGCPIAARTGVSDINPWVWTGGAYVSQRTLKGDTFTVRSHLRSQPTQHCIEMELDLEVEGDVPQITGIVRPFQEEITQTRPGLLRGVFVISFATDNGEVRCRVETEYTLNISRLVPTVFRNITILTCDEGKQALRQIEQIDLFDNKQAADLDLASRIAVQ